MRLRVMVLETDNIATAAEVLAAALQETRDRKPEASTVMPGHQPQPAKPSAHPKRPVGRPRILGPRPWHIAGLSRRTYYRRKAAGTLP
jgi:hypothetical protein